MRRPFIVGVTGGIASGKSTVAASFARLGTPVIDTDTLAREVVQPGTPALKAIKTRFGQGIMQPDGYLNRAAMREIIFADATARAALEAIVHPAIQALAETRIAATEYPYRLLVVPLLIEKGWDKFVDRILVVDASEEIQKQRLIQRDGLNSKQVEAILRSQSDRSTRLAKAHDVITNEGDPDALNQTVASLHQHYLSLAAQ